MSLDAQRGFTLIEVLVSAAIAMAVMGAVFTLLAPVRGTYLAQLELTDMHQRLRVGIDALAHDLRMAGAGPYLGNGGGTLSGSVAPIAPYRVGSRGSGPEQGVFFREDAISVAYVPAPSDDQPELAQVISRTYYLRANAATDTYQLRRYNGLASDLPVVDHVVGLGFEYAGEPMPPALVLASPTGDPAALRATYGPTPPPLDVDTPNDEWGPGENCTFVVLDGVQISRLAVLGQASSLVALPSSMLTDGPWCPDSTAAQRYDADLLRIRRVRVGLIRFGGRFSYAV